MSSVIESHPEYRAFIRKIIASPEDNKLRLAFADWLSEDRDPKRAEFIRLQMKLLELPACPANRKGVGNPGACCQRCDIETRLFNLLVDEGRRLSVNDNPDLNLKIHNDLSNVTVGQVTSHFERGFVSKIEIKCEAFVTAVFDIFTNHPITKVILKDRAPSEAPAGSGKFQYRSDAVASTDSRSLPIPARLFAMLSGGNAIAEDTIQFDSHQQAVDALSNACVGYGHDMVDDLLNA